MHAGCAKRLYGRRTTGLDAPPARRPAEVCKVRPLPLLLACLLGYPSGSPGADATSAHLQVSARVVAHARLEPSAAAATTVIVSAADIERGYLDVVRHYELRTNAPERVSLQIHPRVGLTEAVDIEGLGDTLRLVDDSLEVATLRANVLDLTFRLWLSSGVAPGAYPLPWQLAASVR
jgi:hypothetical protein